MAKIDANLEEERTEIVFRAVQNNPSLKQSELEEHTGLKGRTLNNYLHSLERAGRLKREKQRWYISDVFVERKLRPIELSAEQAMSLYIAARALARVQDERNETAESALIALSRAMVGDFNIGDDMHKAVQDLARRPERTGYNKVYRELMRACVYRKKVKIVYAPAKGDEFETEFEPYLFEPSLFGFSIYAVGYSSKDADYRSYKLERIKSAEMLRAAYDPHDNVPTLHSLKSAWSIMFGDETETVELEFAPSVRKRVLETNWHISQKTDSDDPTINAPLNWKVDVADARDLLPWVRGWGADVTIKQPEWLRNSVIEHVRILNTTYKLATSSNAKVPPHHRLWAKASGKGNLHRLVYHMIDVGMCTQALWRQGLHANLKQRLATWLGLSVEDAGRLVAFWASLHDLGKASPIFQDHKRMNASLKQVVMQELKAAGFTFNPNPDTVEFVRHEIISTWSLRPKLGEGLLTQMCDLPVELAEQIAQMLGGHHGVFPSASKFKPEDLTAEHYGLGLWPQTRRELVSEMLRIFEPPAFQVSLARGLQDNTPLMLLAAIVSAADWLGSDEDNFPYEREYLPISSYAAHAAKHADGALLRVNWATTVDMPAFQFEQAFPFKPSPAQQQAIEALSMLELPALAVVEAQMGAGKTEIALATYAHWSKRTANCGLYVAMPTTATSNQMHDRVSGFLSRQLQIDVKPLLVHSQALIRQKHNDRDGEVDMVEDDEGDAAGGQSWFLPRKKSLLAPYGVGTVDQALMSVLQTKHFFVRLLGLSHKVVIFDEVHAYDTYMTVLFKRLLLWLRAVETSVIVLSATLPNSTRQELIEAYAGTDEMISEKPYPRLTFANANGNIDSVTLAPSDATQSINEPPLQYDWVQSDVQTIVETLREALQKGGCAAVICNTVSRAQDVYQAITQSDLLRDEDKANDLILFHARFPMAWREKLEHDVLKKFGPNTTDRKQKNPDRPNSSERVIVVATQVIEQSLDLDFDVMISDHAPVDLLLQRAGRLHRHKVNNPRLQPYCLHIAAPQAARELPQFSQPDTWVYDEYILQKSWLVLQQREANLIRLPNDLPTLIEQVYSDDESIGDEPIVLSSETRTALAATLQKMTREQFSEDKKARSRRIGKPDDEDVLYGENAELEEGDPTLGEVFQALTRSGRPGLTVVCLHRMDGKLHFEPNLTSSAIYNSDGKHTQALVTELARRALPIRRPAVEHAIFAEYNDPQVLRLVRRWKKIAALKYHRVLIFEDGICRIGTSTIYRLELHKQGKLGLQIFKEAA